MTDDEISSFLRRSKEIGRRHWTYYRDTGRLGNKISTYGPCRGCGGFPYAAGGVGWGYALACECGISTQLHFTPGPMKREWDGYLDV